MTLQNNYPDPIHVDTALITSPFFSTRFCRDDRVLQSSISTHGQLNPLWLIKKRDELLVLDGSTRLEILKGQGATQVSARVFEENILSDADAFLLCLELNRLSRTFNLVEKALFVRQAHELYGGLNIPKMFWEIIDVKPNIKSIHQYKELLKLPSVVLKFAVHNDISLTIILGFLRMPAKEIDKIAAQLFMLPLNQNKLAEILGLLIDTAKREEKSPFVILEETLNLAKSDGNPNLKEQLLRRFLHQRRNPQYETKLSDFEARVKELKLNDGVTVSPAPYFENDYVEVNTRISNLTELERLISDLKKDNWRQILKS